MVFDLSTLKSAEIKPNEPMMRLLVCRKCKTVEEVPSYEGPEGGENTEEYDFALKYFTDDHLTPAGHKEELVTYHLPFKYWIIPKVKESIISQINEGSKGLDVFGTNFYATKDNFTADAMTCWIREHNKTTDCSDYKSERKVLDPGTAAERLEAGLSKKSNGPKVYLCDFCPVKSIVQQKSFKKRGLFK